MGFVFSDKTTGHKTLSISYVSKLCNDNNIHPVAISNIDIDTMNVKKYVFIILITSATKQH